MYNSLSAFMKSYKNLLPYINGFLIPLKVIFFFFLNLHTFESYLRFTLTYFEAQTWSAAILFSSFWRPFPSHYTNYPQSLFPKKKIILYLVS